MTITKLLAPKPKLSSMPSQDRFSNGDRKGVFDRFDSLSMVNRDSTQTPTVPQRVFSPITCIRKTRDGPNVISRRHSLPSQSTQLPTPPARSLSPDTNNNKKDILRDNSPTADHLSASSPSRTLRKIPRKPLLPLEGNIPARSKTRIEEVCIKKSMEPENGDTCKRKVAPPPPPLDRKGGLYPETRGTVLRSSKSPIQPRRKLSPPVEAQKETPPRRP